jgi:predicted DNA binding CopG/RHH family protein
MRELNLQMPRKAKPETVTIRIDRELARIVRMLAAYRGLDVSDYLGPLLRPLVAREMKKAGITVDEPPAPSK